MTDGLRISAGAHSERGGKALNQDFHGLCVPTEPLLSSKGIVAAVADGIGSSAVSHIASETSIKGFLEDYYATPESWSVKTSVQRVLQATSSWLYAQTRNGPYRYAMDRGYVCTFSAIVLKSRTVHIFHVGDSRVYYVAGSRLEQLTEDHLVPASEGRGYLSRALGMRDRVELDYRAYPLEEGDTFLLMTDGVYEFVGDAYVVAALAEGGHDLDLASRSIASEALRRGSTDNLTVQVVRVDRLPQHSVCELGHEASILPFPPELRPRMDLDGYSIVREIHGSSRSHVYLAVDRDTGQQAILKVPSLDLRCNTEYLERFLMEEWVAMRMDSAHLVKAWRRTRRRTCLYTVTELIEGPTLAQWMIDNPSPDLESVRDIVEQIARGLQALHRQEILHQDLRPNNIMIDRTGTVKLIDFGSVRVAGIAEISSVSDRQQLLGTLQYSAPEYFLGELGTTRSDMFSLGVIAYQMLSGRLPYGTDVAKATTRSAQRRLVYRSLLDDGRTVPAWVDGALCKAVHPEPDKRYQEISELVYDLRHPSSDYADRPRAPLLESDPTRFWRGMALLLLVVVVVLLGTHPAIGR